MVGNSPKSDINPALAAGLNAVFVPHGSTWILEHEEVAEAKPPSRLLVVENFAGLKQHFKRTLSCHREFQIVIPH
jgi:putative hydrolase of the HAD superfamily